MFRSDQKKEIEKKQVTIMVTKNQYERIDDFRFKNNIFTQSAAVRLLLDNALNMEEGIK